MADQSILNRSKAHRDWTAGTDRQCRAGYNTVLDVNARGAHGDGNDKIRPGTQLEKMRPALNSRVWHNNCGNYFTRPEIRLTCSRDELAQRHLTRVVSRGYQGVKNRG